MRNMRMSMANSFMFHSVSVPFYRSVRYSPTKVQYSVQYANVIPDTYIEVCTKHVLIKHVFEWVESESSRDQHLNSQKLGPMG